MPLKSADIEEAFNCRESGIKKLLSSILNLNIQYESNEKSIVSIVNRLLSTARQRKEGLQYLNLIVKGLSASVIAEHALTWVNHCIIRYPEDVLRELKLRVLGLIIDRSHEETDFNKRFTSDYISKVFDNCITTTHVNSHECQAALATLIICMKHYPSWFGVHSSKIEKFILIFLDSDHKNSVETAALAFHYLQQVGGAGSNGVNHKQNFTKNFHKLCRTVHALYHKFFENETELFDTESTEEEIFEFQDSLTDNSAALLHVNSRRICNIFKFLEVMLKTGFPVAKETKPSELLEVITRGMSMHKCISADNLESLETYQFSLLLLKIQSTALKLLRLFIICYQSNCSRFSYQIAKLIVDSIQRSHNCGCYKTESLYQETAYKALTEWILVSKNPLHQQFQSQLLECILKDVTSAKAEVTLTISEPESSKKSQKAKRKAMASRIINSANQSANNEDSTQSDRDNESRICQFALTCLKCLLESSILDVKPNLLKDLYQSIFDLLIKIQSSKPQHPYTNVYCQTKLYEVLVVIYHQNSLSVLPPLHTTLGILNRGANDNNRFIANICNEGLRTIESFCQPLCPSLYIGVEREEKVGERHISRHIEVQEGEVDDAESHHSVDFDASTDEFPNNEKSPNSSERINYHVRYTDTDHSTIEDGLSDKGNISENFEVVELSADSPQSKLQDNEMKDSAPPIITAPSEDGNEILESHNDEAEVLEPIQEQTELENEQNNAEASQDTHQDEEETNSEGIITENAGVATEPERVAESTEDTNQIDTLETAKASDNDKHEDVSSTDQIDSPEDATKTPDSGNEDSPVDSTKKSEVTEIKFEEEVEDCEEPAAKKAKFSEDEDKDDIFVETVDKSEEDYLADDSFADEVKDYS